MEIIIIIKVIINFVKMEVIIIIELIINFIKMEVIIYFCKRWIKPF